MPGAIGRCTHKELADPAKSQGSESDKAVGAGRGVIYIALAKLYFMVAGAVLELRLPVVLGNITYGAYGVVNSLVSPFNNVLVTGTIQTISRFSSQRPQTARAVQRAGLRMHLFLGLGLAAAFVALAPLTARLFKDVSKTGPIMLAGAIIAAYSFYAVMVGTANGRREFHKQAGLDITFATLRVAGILGLAIAGLGLMGAIAGWVAAAGLILIISFLVVGAPGRTKAGEESIPLRPMVAFFASLAVYHILLNFIMVADQLLLKRMSAGWFAEHGSDALAALRASVPGELMFGFTEVDPARAADGQVGYYRAVQTLARLSYQAILAATFVIFPLISRATFENDREATARYIQTTTRYSLIFATAIAVVLAANPAEMLSLPFPDDFAMAGGPALIALALGNVAFSVFAIVGTILNGAGLTRPAILVAMVTLAVAAVANAIIIPMFTPGRELLFACATATSAAMLLGAGLGGLILRKQLGAFLPWLTALRVAVAAAGAIALGRVLPWQTALMTLVEAAAVGVTFLVLLIVTRELGGKDLAIIVRVVRRKQKGATP